MADLKNVVERIEKRLEVVGLSASRASVEAGLSKDAIRNLQRAAQGKAPSRGVSSQTVGKLAPVLRTTPGWLLDAAGDSDIEQPEGQRQVPIVGQVGAGSAAYYVPSGELGETDPPDSSSPDTVAVIIRGESLGPVFNGSLLFYDDVRRPVTQDLEGRLCVVGLADGRILVKKLRKAPGRRRYHLLSNTSEDVITDVEVEWAARVKTIRPK